MNVVFVESNTTGTGRLFARAAVALGFRPVLLAEIPDRYPWAKEDGVETLLTRTSSEEEVLVACASIAEDGGLAGVTTSSDYFVVMAAKVAARLSLPGPRPDALAATRDKGRQRTLLAKAGLGCPVFEVVENPQAAVGAAERIGLPVVVKPVNGSGSVGVAFCATVPEVLSHATALLAREHNERGMAIERRVLVESFVRGPEFSVETFGGRAIGVTQKHVGALPSFVELGHDFPAPLDEATQTSLTNAALGALLALGLDFGPAHVEVKLAPTGPVIVEVNPRLAGGFIPELVCHATGIDLIRETVNAALGGAAILESTRSAHASIRFLVPPQDGTLESVEGLSPTDGVVDARIYVSLGMPVAVHGDFRDRIGHVLTLGPDGETARRKADRALAAVRLQVRRPGVQAS